MLSFIKIAVVMVMVSLPSNETLTKTDLFPRLLNLSVLARCDNVVIHTNSQWLRLYAQDLHKIKSSRLPGWKKEGLMTSYLN